MSHNPVTSAAIDVAAITTNLQHKEEGMWYARDFESVSYPTEGNADCFQLEDNSFWFKHRAAIVNAMVRCHPPSGAIFDVGGGNGFMAETLIKAGFSTVLVEPGQIGCENALKRGVADVICATLTTAGFADGVLPAVGLFDVLEHVEDDLGFLGELHRALASGGKLYLTVPAYSWLWSDADVAAGHFRRYTRRSLERCLTSAGFTVRYSTYIFAFLPVPIFLLRALRSRFGRRKMPPRAHIGSHRSPMLSLTDWMLTFEAHMVSTGKKIPFGASIMITAEKH